ncbi:MAG: penicillin-binding protein, partial [Anaerolineae bacterium]|nr:penicillin-binding protein [Anaerolineae bacterium]
EEDPLPKRVPQEDSEATIVAPSTPFLELTRASEVPTESKARQVTADAGAQIAHPAGEGEPGFGDQTIQSDAFDAQATMPSGALVPQQQQLPQRQDLQGNIVLDGERAVQAPAAKPHIGEFPQPDYQEALGPERNRNFYVKWSIRLTIFGVIGGMAIALIALLAMIGYYLYQVDRYRDEVSELTARASDFETSVIYNARGDVLAEFSNPNAGLRTEVGLGEISPWLLHATIATENETFYTDPGFSILAIVRASVQNLQAGDTVSGASTITQQLARALVLETEFAYQRTAERKIVEIIVASEIKRQYSKNEILEIYLNEIFYGNFAYGIEAAAQTYFNKSAADLNPVEAAFLAGLPQSPAGYDPVVNREAALARMGDVLHLMAVATGDGCIEIQHQDQTQWGVAQGQPFCVREDIQPDGSVSYAYKVPGGEWTDLFVELAIVNTSIFEPPAIEFTHPHFVNYVWQQLENRYGAQAVYSAGYKVYTTLDEPLQQTVEREVAANLINLNNQGYPVNNTAVVAIRPSDGAVLAMLGSADYDNDEIKGQVNVAFTAQQPGSTLKPFIYLTAFQPDGANQYMTPASVLWDVNTNFDGYQPVNYDGRFRGPLPVRAALGNSLNIPAVKTLEFTGIFRFTELMVRAGVVFPGGNPVEVGAGLPVALGAQDVQLFELTAAYAMLANEGRKVDPYSIIMIEDGDQNVIYQATASQGEQVVDPEYAYLITDILTDTEARASTFGYGAPMNLAGGRPAAAKTGTSNDSKDVWTLGYTPQLAVGVWIGNTENEPMYNPGARTPYLTGYLGAAPLWNKIMETAHATLPVQPFSPPPGVFQDTVCADSGTQPSAGCETRTTTEIFAVNAPPPPAEGDIFQTLQVDTFTDTLATADCMEFAETRTYLVLDDPFAYDWINSTAEGQNWANERGIETPVQQPPTATCDPNVQRPYVTITFPMENTTVSGVLDVRGTIIMPDFYLYEIRYGIGHNPDQFSPPLVTQSVPKTDTNALLGQLDTNSLANGPYTLQLVVLDRNARSVTQNVHITVNNTAAPPALPTPTLAPTLTPPPVQ